MGVTGEYYYTAPPAPWPGPSLSLWFEGSSNGAYEYVSNGSNQYFNTLYISSIVPALNYFLFANTPRFFFNGVWVTADAVFQGPNSGGGDLPHYMSADPTQAGIVAWAHYPTGPVVDSVGWNKNAAQPSSYWVPAVSTVSLPNCCGNVSLGSPKGNQIVRYSSPTASVGVENTYGHAYYTTDPKGDFFYPTAAFSGSPFPPHNESSGPFAVISGAPAVGAVVSASAGLSSPTTAYSTGSPLRADFVLTNVSTTSSAFPWTVLITSGIYTLENDTVTIPSVGSVYNYPSSTTILNQPTTTGVIAGTVTDVLGVPISPTAIVVSPGPAGANVNASTVDGRYVLRVTPGSVDVVANNNNANASYVSVSSLSVTATLGQIHDNVNFNLSQGGRLTGFVTRDGINALPGVAVSAIDSNGAARDTEITDASGRFTTIDIATGTYDMTPELDSLETSSPTDNLATVGSGQTVFAGTFTITGALGTVSGSVTAGGNTITTGVLIIITTSTLAGSPPAPPALSSGTLASNSLYITSSHEDGTWSVGVRQSTTTLYHAYGYYTTLNSTGAITFQSQTINSISVVAGSTVSGQNFAW